MTKTEEPDILMTHHFDPESASYEVEDAVARLFHARNMLPYELEEKHLIALLFTILKDYNCSRDDVLRYMNMIAKVIASLPSPPPRPPMTAIIHGTKRERLH